MILSFQFAMTLALLAGLFVLCQVAQISLGFTLTAVGLCAFIAGFLCNRDARKG